MLLLELATLAFLEQKYYDLWDTAFSHENAIETFQYCAVWYSLYTACNLSQAWLILRPRVRSLDSIAGRALEEITESIREIENG